MADRKTPPAGPKDTAVYTAADLTEATKTVAKTIAEEMGATMLAAMRSQQPQAPVKGPRVRREECPVCHQSVSGCGGVPPIKAGATNAEMEKAYATNHTLMVVYPTRYPEFGGWFRGRGINGVWYLSDHQNHRIWVPTNAVGDIQRTIEDYETNERETRMGREKNHNSGSLNSPNRVPATGAGGWR